MKNILFVLTLCAFTLLSCNSTKGISKSAAKSPAQSIKDDFAKYNQHILDKEFEESMNYILPEFFEYFPKKDLIAVMEMMFNGTEVIFDLGEPRNIEIGEIEQIEERYYATINYDYDMNVKYVSLADPNATEEEQELTRKLIITQMENAMGGKVSYDEETDFYSVVAKKVSFAISDDGLSNWKFVVVENEQKALLEKLLPQKLIDNL